MPDTRTEHDLLGERNIPAGALYGIHSLRAQENFPIAHRPIHPELIRAYGAVKLACARTNHEQGAWNEPTAQALFSACSELMNGSLDRHILVDALQGGAGTSTNMNVNEVIANRALQILGKNPGDYSFIHPIDDVNLHQSTNDTYPTALKIAAITLLRRLEEAVAALVEAFQAKEKEFAHVVKVGRTEYQDAVLVTLGREMSAYAEAFGRDRWRIYKCEERLRVVNLGGTAIGTGLGAPRTFIFRVIENLREITGIGLARAENLVEATQNADVFTEVSGILKACAVNLLKVANDLRLLSSGPDAGLHEIILPEKQAGSSIMPGKVNPVIPEAVAQTALLVLSNDQAIAAACALGSLELNAFYPLIADLFLGNLSLLFNAVSVFRTKCVEGLRADEDRCRRSVENSSASLTALVERLGYQTAQQVGLQAKAHGTSIKETVCEMGLLSAEEFDDLTGAEAVSRLGSSSKDHK